MIETKVPKDVRSYKTKILGPLTLRQIICIVVAGIFDIILYMIATSMNMKLNAEMVIYSLIFLNLPIFAFMLEVQGMTMEKYIKNVLLDSFLKPSKRKAENLLYEDQKLKPLTKKELKAREKKISSVARKNPELKPFE